MNTKLKELFENMKQLKETEVLAIKFADGEITQEEWEPVRLKRKELKEAIKIKK